MTDDDTSTPTPSPDREAQTLNDVSHTNPYTDEPFGHTQVYHRGQTIAADGGRDPAFESEAEPDDAKDANDRDANDRDANDRDANDRDARADDQLKDVHHTPPKDADSANRVHQRGREDRDESE